MPNNRRQNNILNDGPSGLVSGGSGITDSFFSNYEEFSHNGTYVLYRARRYGRWYVLKALREELRGNAAYEEWLFAEYAVGINLDHPNIVRMESFEDNALLGHCIVMEWVESVSLDRWLQEAQPSSAERRQVLRQLFNAVEYCHSHDIHHHLLTPHNILISTYGSVKLVNFSLGGDPQKAETAWRSEDKSYAAPELLNGTPCDHRADIYSLGKITALMFPHRSIGRLRKALQMNPDRRHQSAREFRLRLTRKRWPWLLALAILLAVLVSIFIIPSKKKHQVTLASGQTLYCRILENFPRREVALVYPGTEGDPWPAEFQAPEGRMVIPATVKINGLPYRVKEIDDHAFRNLFNLTSLKLPEGLESIGLSSFCACSGLRDTLVIPRSLKRIGHSAFNDCSNLTTVVWQADSCNAVRTFPDYTCFYRCTRLRAVLTTPNVRHLPSEVFTSVEGLRTVDLADGVRTIPVGLFTTCTSLDSVRYPSTLHTIEHGAFYKSRLSSVKLPESTEVVSNYAFAYSHWIRHIELGPRTCFLGNYAFAECFHLKSVTLRAPTPPEVQPTTFDQMPSDAVLYVPPKALEAYRQHPVWSQFGKIEEIEN